MTSDDPKPPPDPAPLWRSLAWTATHRRTIAILLLLFWVYLGARYAMHPHYVSDPQPRTGSRASELADRLDINTATWQELTAIPNLGEKRAQAIVAFREAHAPSATGPVFKSANDLLRVRGIGAATATKLKEYLIFPSTQPDK